MEVLKLLKNIPMDTVSIEETGCLGNCGDGPNVAVSDGQVFMNVDTKKACDILDAFYGVKIGPVVIEALELKREGNELVQAGQPAKAVAVYTSALALGCTSLMHVLYANRAAAHLICNQLEEAESDARKAIEASPSGYVNGYVRLADAQARQRDFEAALATLAEAVQKVPDFGQTPQYKAQLTVLQTEHAKAKGQAIAA